MRFKLQGLLAITLLCAVGASVFVAAAQRNKGQGSISSVYTNLTGCRTVSVDRESASYVERCAGIAGYKLDVETGDERMSISVIAPGGKKSELSYWQVITSAFSSLGNKAEWRVQKVGAKTVPVALIVRVNASENPENPGKTTSYLAVAKITPQRTCVTDKIAQGARANEEARRAADSAASKPCLEDTRQE
ncbi:MAG TPA: hypothetical protein VF735_02835 [Pyrinomonadaceae bacterium]|jgi:hypothetical protein